MNELARCQKPPPPEDYYIEAETSLVDRPLLTLKQNDLFGVFNNHGDFRMADKGPEGLFFLDTRYLSQFELRLGRKPPLLLDSVVLDDNSRSEEHPYELQSLMRTSYAVFFLKKKTKIITNN